MNDEINKIFEEYLEQQADSDPIDFNPLVNQYPQFKESLEKKISAYKKIVGVFEGKQAEPAAPATSQVGRIIGGCRLLKVLGQGGMGVVYLARQENLNRDVVVKLLRPFAVDNKALKERFLRESRTVGRLNHKNIVPVYDVGEEEGSFFIIMQHVQGVPLNKLIESLAGKDRSALQLKEIAEAISQNLGQPSAKPVSIDGKSPTEFFCNLIIKVADAVQYAHDNGVIHRDIKPSNIILEPDGNPVLLDFGLSHDDVEINLTLSGDFLGTPIYSAPETFLKEKAGDQRLLDVYSLGVTLYELLTGGLPYEAISVYEIYSAIRFSEAKSPKSIWKNIPKDLETIILKSIEKDARLRYNSVIGLGQDLTRFLNYQPIKATPPSISRKIFKWTFRNRRLAITCVLGIALAIAAIFFGVRIKSRIDVSQNKTRLVTALKNYDFDSALIATQSLVDLNPNDRESWMLQAGLKYGQGNYEEALVSYNKAADLEPNDIKVYLELARTYYRLERLNDAEMSLQRAFKIAPNNYEVLRAIGVARILSGDYDSALEYLARAKESESDYLKGLSKSDQVSTLLFNVSIDLALAKHFQGNDNGAITTLLWELASYPRHTLLHKTLMNILEGIGPVPLMAEEKKNISQIPSLSVQKINEKIGCQLFIPFGWWDSGSALIYGKDAILDLMGVPRIPSELIDKPEIIIYQTNLIQSRQELLKGLHARVTKFGGSILKQETLTPPDSKFIFYELTTGYAFRNRPATILTAVANSGSSSTIYALVSHEETFNKNRIDFEWMLSNLKPLEKNQK